MISRFPITAISPLLPQHSLLFRAGVNNDFLVNTLDPLALVHNDRSPMESHHCSLAFTTLFKKGNNFISNLPQQDKKAFM